MLELVIIGLGSWGLCALERVVSGARRQRSPGAARVHVVEPAAPGAGVYSMSQPDYLLMNNPCGQLSMYPDADDADDAPRPSYGLGLYEWCRWRGYRWVADTCRIAKVGKEISPHDFLPRRVMAEYLEWFYRALLAEVPPGLEIVHHPTWAVDVVAQPWGGELVLLANGDSLLADHVILTSGHTANTIAEHGVAHVNLVDPYPVQRYVDSLPARAPVGVTGMGLVATDVVTALTVGRGGSFVDEGDRKRYVRTGREPVIYLFSRSGLPYCAKSVSGIDQTGDYEPAICTPSALAALRPHGQTRARRQVDLRADLLPLVFAEMQLRYYSQSALLGNGPLAEQTIRRQLTRAWHAGDFPAETAAHASRYGTFDPAQRFFGHAGPFVSSKDYETQVYDLVEADLDEALMAGGSSPVKCADEVFRILRDGMRSVIEFGGLSLGSYDDFQENIRSRINRIVAGPPALRSQQLLALMDADVVKAPFGPSPVIEAAGSTIEVRSSALERPYAKRVDCLIQGHLEDPTVHRSASPLLGRLFESGRVQQFRYGDVEVGSIHLSCDFHPINAVGDPEERIWVFGVLTEGVRYFNHYIPSPKSRIRAFVDLQRCINEIARGRRRRSTSAGRSPHRVTLVHDVPRSAAHR